MPRRQHARHISGYPSSRAILQYVSLHGISRHSRSAAAAEGTVEVESGADERQMRECLREVPKCFAARARLFRIKSQMIRVGQHLLEQKPRLFEPATIFLTRARQSLHQPEGADV